MEAAGFVLAMDFGGTKMALATADLSGRIIEERRLPTRAARGADQAIARALDVARTLVESAAAHHGDGPAAVGVSSMGNTYDDHVEMAPNVVGWSELALPERLRGALRTNDIRIENDVKAAARAEVKWGGLAGVEVGVFVNIGTGFAVAPVIGRRVL